MLRSMAKKELAKQYEPREVEKRIYAFWQDGGYFHAQVNDKKKPYTIVMPPPNMISARSANGNIRGLFLCRGTFRSPASFKIEN